MHFKADGWFYGTNCISRIYTSSIASYSSAFKGLARFEVKTGFMRGVNKAIILTGTYINNSKTSEIISSVITTLLPSNVSLGVPTNKTFDIYYGIFNNLRKMKNFKIIKVENKMINLKNHGYNKFRGGVK